MSLADYLDDITRILENEAPGWLRGGTAKASIVRHARMTECLRIDITYTEPASIGVRFIPRRAFDGCMASGPHVGRHFDDAIAMAERAAVLRGAILVEAADPSAGCSRCGKAGQPALVDGVCRRCEAYPGVR